ELGALPLRALPRAAGRRLAVRRPPRARLAARPRRRRAVALRARRRHESPRKRRLVSASLAPRGAAESIPLRKRLSHRLKASLFRSERLDAWIDRHAGFFDGSATRSALLQRASLRLMPERASRHSALAAAADSPATRGTMMILTLVPPEDGGG